MKILDRTSPENLFKMPAGICLRVPPGILPNPLLWICSKIVPRIFPETISRAPYVSYCLRTPPGIPHKLAPGPYFMDLARVYFKFLQELFQNFFLGFLQEFN